MKNKHKKSAKKENKAKAIGIGIGSGIIASLCCLGPAFIVLLGLGSLSVALSLTQFQPYFLALSIFFMVGAIWIYLRRRNQGRCDLHVMKRNKGFIGVSLLVMVVFYVVALYVVMPAITPYIYGTVDSSTNLQRTENLRQATLEIYGMTCPSCADAVESLLKQEEGIISVDVDYFQGTGRVVYDSDKITIEEIMEAMKPYTATVIDDEEWGKHG